MSKTLSALISFSQITPEDVAERSGLPLDLIENIEAGQIRIDADIAEKLSKVFSIDPELFIERASGVINYNQGNNSHSGPIHNYSNINTDQLNELIEKLLVEKNKRIEYLEARLVEKENRS